MTEQFLSLKDAQSHTGKSRSTLRRFVEKITKVDNHPDRGFIQPDVDEVTKLHAESHPFSWRVSTTLLDREYAKEGTASNASTQNDSRSTANNDLLSQTISMLKTELDEKNKQIAQFQERQRETNIMLQQTTEKLMLLTDGKKQRDKNETAVTVTSKAGDSEASEEGIHTATTNEDATTTKKRSTLWQLMNKPFFQK